MDIGIGWESVAVLDIVVAEVADIYDQELEERIGVEVVMGTVVAVGAVDHWQAMNDAVAAADFDTLHSKDQDQLPRTPSAAEKTLLHP